MEECFFCLDYTFSLFHTQYRPQVEFSNHLLQTTKPGVLCIKEKMSEELITGECCICYTTTKHNLSCARGDHFVCLKCVQKLLHYCDCGECLGIGWRCPLCRTCLGLDATQLLAVGFGSHKIVDKIKEKGE